jgi:hypothetical protein
MSESHREAGETFDVIVIGSSPLLLIEALYLEREGHRVAIVEKRDRLGGAWYTNPLWEFDSVQIGCHYIERGRKGYAFLREFLGIALEPQSVKAVWCNTDDVIHEDEPLFRKISKRFVRMILWGRFLSDDVWGVIKSLGRKDPYKFARAVKRMIVSPPYLYPTEGARSVVDSLAGRIASSSIELLDNSFVEYVVAGTDGRPNRCCIDGRTYYAKTLVLGQHVYPKLQMFEGEREEVETRYEINVLLRISGEKGVPFDYFEIHRNDLINRVQDVSAFAHARGPSTNPASDLLICCNLTNTGTKESNVDTTKIFSHLVELGMLENGARLLDSHVERYPSPETKDAESNESVRIIATYDFGVGLQRNADRWKSLLQQ